MIAGEIAAKRKDWERAVLHLERAVRYEDALNYQEPPDWHVPARQNLAGVLMAAGRADEAETLLWEDLKRNPGPRVDLSLLSKALRLQDKAADCGIRSKQRWRNRRKEAWPHGELSPPTSPPAPASLSSTRGCRTA